MVESSTILTLPKMCDLALNTPEVRILFDFRYGEFAYRLSILLPILFIEKVGVVNFTVLHSLLQVMMKQLNLVDTIVEFRGADSERMQHFITASVPGNSLTLTEYTIGGGYYGDSDSDDEDQSQTKKEKGLEDESQKEKTGETTQKKKKSGVPKKDQSLGLTADNKRKSTVILVDPSRDQQSSGTQFTVAVTKGHFEELQQKIQDIENRMRELEGLPTNENIMIALQEGGEKTPVLDMYQILSLQKRMDAVDQGMEKLATMVETVARGSIVELDIKFNKHQSAHSGEIIMKTLRERVEDIEKSLNIVHVPIPSSDVSPEAPSEVSPDAPPEAEVIEKCI